jgi:hypothetical protein
MNRNQPLPLCKAFLVCHAIQGNILHLIGQDNRHFTQHFPSTRPLSFWARLTGGHGQYAIGVQLQTCDGTVVWRSGSLASWPSGSPLQTAEVPMHALPVFPAPGDYYLVLTANDEEIAREPFFVRPAS